MIEGGHLPLAGVTPAESFAAVLQAHGLSPKWDGAAGTNVLQAPDGTTVLAFRLADSVIMAGDRRATSGHLIAHRRVQKVYPADDYSAVAISGTAGIALELVRLFQTELEHYEKIEGHRLSVAGKANHLATMIRKQLPMAFQGLGVIPLFCGVEEADGTSHLYSFDIVGGSYEEIDYAATGSGGRDARLFLRTAYRPDMDTEEAIDLAVAALVAAAEEDTATGGPDMLRKIYPNVAIVDAAGYREIEDERVAEAARRALGDGS